MTNEKVKKIVKSIVKNSVRVHVHKFCKRGLHMNKTLKQTSSYFRQASMCKKSAYHKLIFHEKYASFRNLGENDIKQHVVQRTPYCYSFITIDI